MKKKIIALFLAMILLISFSSVVTVFAEIEHDEKLYIDLGIFPEKKTNGLIKPVLNREQFSQIIVKMLGVEEVLTYEKDLAVDITRNKSKAEINYCIENGYLTVDGEQKFRPSDGVSYNDAIRAMVNALEYDIAIKDKSNDSEYFAVANKIGILKGVKIENREKLSYSELYQILSLSMKVKLPIHEKEFITDSRSLYDRLNVVEYKGTLLATSSTSIGVERTFPGFVNIDGTIYRTKVEVQDILVGTEIVYYFSVKEDMIVSISSRKTVNTLELYPSEIKSISDNGEYITLKTNGTEEKIQIRKSAIMIVNNKTMAPTEELFNNFKDGYAIFVDSDNNGEYDVVHMSIAKTITVAGASALTYSVLAEYDEGLIKLEKADDNIEVYMSGKTAMFTDIKKGHIISVICDAFSFDENGDIVYDYDNISWAKVYISNSVVSGMVDSIDESFVYINDMDYLTSNAFEELVNSGKKQKIKVNEFVDVRLDNWGCIADVEVDKGNSGYSYGYLINAGIGGSGFSKFLELKILNENGVLGIYRTCEKFIIDGKAFKKPDLSFDVGTSEEVNLKKRQVISFRVSTDGRIKSIDTAIRSSSEEDSSLEKSMEIDFDPYRYTRTAGEGIDDEYNRFDFSATGDQPKTPVKTSVVNKKVAIGADCVIFLDQAGLNDDDPADYYFSVAPTESYSETEGCYIALYDTDDMNSAKCGAVWESYDPTGPKARGSAEKQSLEYTVNSYMVEKVRPFSDKNDNEYFEITLANYAGKAVYKTVPVEKLSLYSIKAGSKGEQISSWTHTSGSESRPKADTLLVFRQEASDLASIIKRGDLVRISLDTEGKISYIERILSFESLGNEPIPFTGTSGTNMVYANLYKTSQGIYMYEVPDKAGEYEIFNTMSRAGVVVYDVKAKEANIYTDLSMVPSISTGDDAKVWLRDYHNGRTREYFIYLY